MTAYKFLTASLSAGLMILVTSSSGAHAAACIIEDAELNCGTDPTAIVENMANVGTDVLFSLPSVHRDTFDGNGDAREKFRRSLESIRKDIEQYNRINRRLRLSGEINQAEQQRRFDLYSAAIKSYGEGYWFYKNLKWQSN